MSSSHTPGPWKLDWTIAGGGCLEDYPELQYVNIRSANYFEVAPDGLSLTGFVRLADANLIAAAPDLLAALKEMGDWIAAGLQASGEAWPDERCLKHTEEIAARARTAVDKAEGRI